MCNKQKNEIFNNHFEVKEIDKPKSWRLLVQLTADQYVEEAVFTVQGVLISKELPTLQEKSR